MGDLDRCLRLGARRVDDADERQHRQLVDDRQQVGGLVERLRVEIAVRGRHDPQTIPAETIVLVLRQLADLVDRDGLAGPVVGVGRARHQLVGSALDVAADDRLALLVGHLVERGHELVGRVERHLGDARVLLAREHRIDAALRGEHDERALRRIADERPVLGDRIGA